MITTGPGKKLTIYLDETDTFHGKPAYEAVLDILYRHQAAGASVFRGIEGFGSNHQFHTAKILELSTSLPVKIEVVDTGEKINTILLEVTPIVRKGLIAVSDTTIVKSADGK
jgi:PII-like signaling protein